MYKRRVRVMPSGASMTGELKLFNLLNEFQDTAELAVEGIEGKSTELYERGYSWVVTRYDVRINGELPMIGDEYEILTYHDPNHSYNTLRNFHARIGGREIVQAKTSWILADVRSGRPVKPLTHLPEIAGGDCENIEEGFTEIPKFDEADETELLTVKYHDTDYNGHVNHAVYFRWVIDILGKVPSYMSAVFRSGAKLGEAVRIERSGGIFRVMRGDKERPCAEFMTGL